MNIQWKKISGVFCAIAVLVGVVFQIAHAADSYDTLCSDVGSDTSIAKCSIPLVSSKLQKKCSDFGFKDNSGIGTLWGTAGRKNCIRTPSVTPNAPPCTYVGQVDVYYPQDPSKEESLDAPVATAAENRHETQCYTYKNTSSADGGKMWLPINARNVPGIPIEKTETVAWCLKLKEYNNATKGISMTSYWDFGDDRKATFLCKPVSESIEKVNGDNVDRWEPVIKDRKITPAKTYVSSTGKGADKFSHCYPSQKPTGATIEYAKPTSGTLTDVTDKTCVVRLCQNVGTATKAKLRCLFELVYDATRPNDKPQKKELRYGTGAPGGLKDTPPASGSGSCPSGQSWCAHSQSGKAECISTDEYKAHQQACDDGSAGPAATDAGGRCMKDNKFWCRNDSLSDGGTCYDTQAEFDAKCSSSPSAGKTCSAASPYACDVNTCSGKGTWCMMKKGGEGCVSSADANNVCLSEADKKTFGSLAECMRVTGDAPTCYGNLPPSGCDAVGAKRNAEGKCEPTFKSLGAMCDYGYASKPELCNKTDPGYSDVQKCILRGGTAYNPTTHKCCPVDEGCDQVGDGRNTRDPNQDCSSGQVKVNGQCQSVSQALSCPQGTTQIGTQGNQPVCQAQQQGGSQSCPQGTQYVGMQGNQPMCQQQQQQRPQQQGQQGTFGQNPYQQQQQQQQCPQGYQLTNGYCQPQQCQSGYQLVNGYCQPQQCQWDSVDNETATVWSDCASTQAIYDSRVATYNDNVLIKFNDNMNQWTSMRQQGQCSKKPQRPAAPQQCTSGSTGANDPKAAISCHDPNNVPRASYEPGMPFTIEHTCTNSTGSTGTNFNTNNQTSGSVQVTLSASSTLNTYAVTCTNGTKTASAQCSVNVQTPRIAFTATPSLITKEMIANKQATSTVGWVTSAMASCRIMNMGDTKFNEDNSSNTSVNGAVDYVVTKTTTFTLTCTSVSGKVKAANTVITVR